jgi:hypothetical protein
MIHVHIRDGDSMLSASTTVKRVDGRIRIVTPRR